MIHRRRNRSKDPPEDAPAGDALGNVAEVGENDNNNENGKIKATGNSPQDTDAEATEKDDPPQKVKPRRTSSFFSSLRKRSKEEKDTTSKEDGEIGGNAEGERRKPEDMKEEAEDDKGLEEQKTTKGGEETIVPGNDGNKTLDATKENDTTETATPEKRKRSSSFFSSFRKKKAVDEFETKDDIPGDKEGDESGKEEAESGKLDKKDTANADKENDDHDGIADVDIEAGEKKEQRDVENDVGVIPGSADASPIASPRKRGFLGMFGTRNSKEKSSPEESDLEALSPDQDDSDEDPDIDPTRKLFGEGDDGGHDIEKGEEKMPEKTDSETRPVPPSFPLVRVISILLVAAVVIILASLGTAYLGTKLAIENERSGTINTPPADVSPTMAPTFGGTSRCENRDDYLLEFVLTFDSKPQEVGFSLFSTGAAPSALWNMKPKTFFSFGQLQRKNIFRICISSLEDYIFNIEDTAENGLIDTIGATYVYGSWELRFEQEVVAFYEGDCEADTSQIQLRAQNKTQFFCVGANSTAGECLAPEKEEEKEPGSGVANVTNVDGTNDNTVDDVGGEGNATNPDETDTATNIVGDDAGNSTRR